MRCVADVEHAHRLEWLPEVIPGGVQLVCSCTPGAMADRLTQRQGWVTVEMPAIQASERAEVSVLE